MAARNTTSGNAPGSFAADIQVPAPTALRPEAQAMLQAIGQHQEATQPYVPFPAGTPTLQTQQFREGQRQFDEQFREGQRQFDERMAFEKEQYAEALRQAAMKGAGGVSPEAQQMNVLDQLRAITEQAVNAGKSFDVVSDFIQMNAPYFGGIGKTDDIEDIAKTMYRTALGSYDPYTRYEASGRPYIPSGSEIRKYQDLLGSTQAQIEPEGEWEHVSGNTYRNRLTGS